MNGGEESPLDRVLRQNPALEELDRRERAAFCREVMERLSEIVEGKGPPDFMARVEKLLGDCNGYDAMCRTLRATIDLARECGEEPPPCVVDPDALDRCVARVRRKLAEEA